MGATDISKEQCAGFEPGIEPLNGQPLLSPPLATLFRQKQK